MLTFTTARKIGYRQRTLDNSLADVTLAFAYNFNTAGEKLTKNSVLLNRRTYIQVPLEEFEEHFHFLVDRAVDKINASGWTRPIVLNIAGNGLHTCAKFGGNQAKVDAKLFVFLAAVIRHKQAKFKVELIRSGGQTGADEAGLKAAVRLNIPALCHAPADWVFRGADGVDIYDESRFKARFSTKV